MVKSEICNMPIKKMPPIEGRPSGVAKLWVNGLRRNATPLELCKLDIRSTWNNL
jgi:hypothetical protein